MVLIFLSTFEMFYYIMLGKNLISSVLTQLPIFVLGIVSGVFSTRILGEEVKGVFSIFQANYLFFLLVFAFGIQTGIVYFISSKKYAEDIVAGISMTVLLLSSTLLLLFLFFSHYLQFSHYYLPDNYNEKAYVFAIFILFFLSLFNSLLSSFFQARNNFRLINRVAILNSVFNVLMFGGLYLYHKNIVVSSEAKFNYVLLSTLFILLINTLIWIYLYIKKISVYPSFNTDVLHTLKVFISYSLLIYISMLINFFNYRLDLWIVNTFLDNKQLSYYSLAANIVQVILYLSVTIASVIFPSLSNKNEDDRAHVFIRVSRFSFLFFLTLILIAFLSSNYIIPFMYGKEFLNAIVPFQILSVGILFSCVSQLLSILLVASNLNKYDIIARTIGLVFTVVLDIVWIKQFGIIGAAYATLTSYFIICLITFIFVIRNTNIKTINIFFPTKEDWNYLLKRNKRV